MNSSFSVVILRTWTSLNLSDVQAVLLNHFTAIFPLETGQLVDLVGPYGRCIDGQGPTLVHIVTSTGPSQKNWKEAAADSGKHKNKAEF